MGSKSKIKRAEDKNIDPPTPVVPTKPEAKQPIAIENQLIFSF